MSCVCVLATNLIISLSIIDHTWTIFSLPFLNIYPTLLNVFWFFLTGKSLFLYIYMVYMANDNCKTALFYTTAQKILIPHLLRLEIKILICCL